MKPGGDVLQDLRYAIRGFSRNPGFTAAAVVTSAVPARRAASISPVEALRTD